MFFRFQNVKYKSGEGTLIRISEQLVWDGLIGICHRQCWSLSLIHAFRPLGPEFSLPGSASHQAFGRRLKVVRNLVFPLTNVYLLCHHILAGEL